MLYLPHPIKTKDIVLSPEIEKLAEKLAENTHEVWAYERMRDGWVYGEQRDDKLRTHPCLVPYNQLSEDEKKYDRSTALETLRLIIKLGFNITK